MPPDPRPGADLYASAYNRVKTLAAGVYLIERTERRFEDAAAIHTEYAALIEALRSPAPKGVLLDLRAARGRNDPTFEAALEPYRRRMLSVTPNTVILAQSAVGSLQIKRHMEADGLDHVRVVRDLEEARRLVLGG